MALNNDPIFSIFCTKIKLSWVLCKDAKKSHLFYCERREIHPLREFSRENARNPRSTCDAFVLVFLSLHKKREIESLPLSFSVTMLPTSSCFKVHSLSHPFNHQTQAAVLGAHLFYFCRKVAHMLMVRLKNTIQDLFFVIHA